MNGRIARAASITNQYGPDPDLLIFDAVVPACPINPTGCVVEKNGCPSNPTTFDGLVTASLIIVNSSMSGCTFVSHPSCSIIGSYTPYESSSISLRSIDTVSSKFLFTIVYECVSSA